jgi:hypothetical protein
MKNKKKRKKKDERSRMLNLARGKYRISLFDEEENFHVFGSRRDPYAANRAKDLISEALERGLPLMIESLSSLLPLVDAEVWGVEHFSKKDKFLDLLKEKKIPHSPAMQ